MKYLDASHKRTIGLSSLGGMLEFYDFIIFIFFASSISKLFYPSDLSSFWSSMNTYAIFAAGYFARPLGGIVMAHFGDRFGRKNVFMMSILLMVIPTFLIGIAPTYKDIGLLAPLLLIIVRILQGIAIGGELPGAWTFVSEHVRKERLGFSIGVLTSSIVGGILLGSIVSLVMRSIYTAQEIDATMWRVPFILGGIFGLISILLRRYLEETPVFKEMRESGLIVKFPLKELIKESKYKMIISAMSTWVLTACVLIFILLIPVNFYKISSISPHAGSILQIIGILLVIAGCILFGILRDRSSIKVAGITFALGLLASSYLFFSRLFYPEQMQFLNMGFDDRLAISIYYLICCFFAGIVVFTPIAMVEMFRPNIRYSGISFSYNISYAIFGGMTPIIFQIAITKSHAFFIYYFIFISALGILCSIAVDKVTRS